MFRRKLSALDHHQPETFDIKDEQQLRNMIVWLEDQKIRHYKIEDRELLRNIESQEWPTAFKQYLEDLACPYPADESREVLVDWVLGLAVRLEYGDNVAKYKSVTPSQPSDASADAATSSENPLDRLDYASDEFKAGLMKVADLLKISPRPNDTLTMLKAVSTVISTRFSKEAIARATQQAAKPEGYSIALEDVVLGFDAGDHMTNQAARILRLLHIHDLRELQTKINEAIVAVQSITANPKTDARLGQVGR